MATTRLTDIVLVKTFAKIVESKITENSKFRQSGLIVSDPRIVTKANTAGFEGTLPFWKPIAGGEAATMNDDPTSKGTPAKVEQGSMTARMIQRALSFAAMDLADYASDSDAIEYAAGEFARLWTPVDTSRARQGWTAETPSAPYEPGIIENNVEYIGVLNDGHSPQAPAGFVETTVQKHGGAID